MIVSRKTGFYGFDPVVIDANGLFYERTGEVTFNLPPGEYEIDNAEPLANTLRYLAPLPYFPERFNMLGPVQIIKTDYAIDRTGYQRIKNCGINIYRKELYINPEFDRYSTPYKHCLLLHEFGHFFYRSEHKCDRYAMYKMLKLGYNPSQFYAFIELLSEYSDYRKELATQYAENVRENTNCAGYFGLLGF